MTGKDTWPFDQPRDCAVFTTTHITSGNHPILCVFHDEDDHGWQFLPGFNITMADAMLVALQEIVDIDPSVIGVADMQPGWHAVRDSANGAWRRRQTERNDEPTSAGDSRPLAPEK